MRGSTSVNGSKINGINVKVNTTDRGLQFIADVQHIRGIGHNLYHTQLNATALNNTIDFNLDIDDAGGRDKYYLSGILSQPSQGNYTLSLRSDSLLMNYDKWTVSANNSLTITKDNIIANNFILQKKRSTIITAKPGRTIKCRVYQFSTVDHYCDHEIRIVAC